MLLITCVFCGQRARHICLYVNLATARKANIHIRLAAYQIVGISLFKDIIRITLIQKEGRQAKGLAEMLSHLYRIYSIISDFREGTEI